MIQGCPEYDYDPARDVSDFLLMRMPLPMISICFAYAGHAGSRRMLRSIDHRGSRHLFRKEGNSI